VNPQFCLVQHRTKLYLVRHEQVAFHVMYQRVFQQFGEMRAIQLQEPIPIAACVLEALDNPRNGYDKEDGPKEQLAQEIQALLVANGPMLAEYFALDIDAQVGGTEDVKCRRPWPHLPPCWDDTCRAC